MVSASPERNFPNTEIYLPFAQTDRFARMNGKQPECLSTGLSVECFNCFRLFGTLVKHEARVFEMAVFICIIRT